MLEISETPCCAINWLHGAHNDTTIAQLKRELLDSFVSCSEKYCKSDGECHKLCFEGTILAVTTPGEKMLARRLISLGFQCLALVPRTEKKGEFLRLWKLSFENFQEGLSAKELKEFNR